MHIFHLSVVLAAGLGLAACAGKAPREAEIRASAAATALSVVKEGSGLDLRLARATRSAGDLNSAANLYRDVLSRDPGNPEIAIELADVLIDSGLAEQAVDLLKGINADPASAKGSGDIFVGIERGMGRAYLAMQKPDAALEHFIKARDRNPQEPRSLVDCGVALDLLRRHAEAQDSYRAAIRVAPHEMAARNDLALSLALTQHYDAALEIILPVARLASATPQMRQNLALIYGLKGDSDTADALSLVDLDRVETSSNMKLFSALRSGLAGPQGGSGTTP
jgi:Flp pilus assembly protein TadD